MSDINSKLECLKVLRSEMKDWKKDDLRKKKGAPEKQQEAHVEQSQKASMLQEVLARLSK